MTRVLMKDTAVDFHLCLGTEMIPLLLCYAFLCCVVLCCVVLCCVVLCCVVALSKFGIAFGCWH